MWGLVHDRIRKGMSPGRSTIQRKWSPLLVLVWTKGDITVSLSGHENPPRTNGDSLHGAGRVVKMPGFLLTHTCCPLVCQPPEGYLCAAQCVQPCESRGCHGIRLTPLKMHVWWRPPGPVIVCEHHPFSLPLCSELTEPVCHFGFWQGGSFFSEYKPAPELF